MRVKQGLAGVALAGGLLAGGATVAWAQTTPSTTPSTTAPSGSTNQAPPAGGMKGNCPNMGGSSSSTSNAQTQGYQGV